MLEKDTEAQQSSMKLDDVYFIVFRHKWKIVTCFALGLLAAIAIFFLRNASYVSEAKIYVRYVSDRPSLNPASRDDTVKSPDPDGQDIINSQIQILTSRDLAEQVIDIVGVDKFFGGPGRGNRQGAVEQMLLNLRPQVPPRSSIIVVSFYHPEPEVAQRVLKLLVEKYLEKHIEIHRALGTYDFLASQTDQWRQRLVQTEANLLKVRTNAGVVSFQMARGALAVEMSQVRSSLLQQETDLHVRQVLLASIPRPLGATNEPAVESPRVSQDFGLYRATCQNLDQLRARELEMLGRLTDQNPAVQAVGIQITELEKRKREMEASNPQLALATLARPGNSGVSTNGGDHTAQIPEIEAGLKVLGARWERLKAEAAHLDVAEDAINDLERRRKVEEDNFRSFSASLEKARIDQALDAGKFSNISVVQAASAPAASPRGRLKAVGIALAAGLALGLGLAVLFEFVIAPTVKRPEDFYRIAQLPLMLTIPIVGANGAGSKLAKRKNSQGEIAVETLPSASDPAHPLRPYFDALRDRILVRFEGIVRKPKLIGVTSCSHGAGSSSIAAGLAASLSEIGDGNVLLVDLNSEQGAAHPFFKGQPVCALHDAVEQHKRRHGLVLENLYLASINEPNGAPSAVPSRRIAEIMPKLRASDYDYIIFDMPSISETSITFRMAGFMDKVLLVVESDKTHRDLLKQANALLLQSKTKVEAVLNRHRRHVPQFLAHELNGSEIY